MRRGVLALMVVAVLTPAAALAQSSPGRFEIDGGAAWTGAVSFDSVAANEATLGGGTRPLFDTASRFDASIGAVLGVGVRLNGAIQLEGNFGYHPTHLTTRITADAEGIADASPETSISQYAFGGDLLLQRNRWRRYKVAPYAVAGAAYLRQVSEGRTRVQTGPSYSAGGGVYLGRERKGGGLKSSGVRIEGRALVVGDGLSLDGKTHVAPTLTLSVFGRF